MRKIIFLVMAVLVSIYSINSINGLAQAQESQGLLEKINFEASGSFDFYTDYIWRGFTLDRDPVIQPGFNIGAYGFTFSFWSSWDTRSHDGLDSDEMDFVLDYTYDFKYLSLSAGHTFYEFPEADARSREFYVGASLTTIPLTPTLTFYYDYADEDDGGGDGQYIVLDLSHSIPITAIDDLDVTLDLGGHVGFNNELFIAGQGGDVLLTAGLTIPLTKNLSVSPNINYSIPFGDLSDEEDGNQDDRFYGGFSLSYTF